MVKIIVAEAPDWGLFVSEVRGTSNESLRLHLQEQVEAHLAYRPDGTPTYTGSFKDLPSKSRLIFKGVC